MRDADLVVIGGGIVGLATAWRFQERRSGRRATVLEKEEGLARHQSGRNSGVIHSGIYYKPGTLKAANCRRGKRMLEAFCREEGVPFETCGKTIVAVEEAEVPRLERLLERGLANGVDCERIGPERLREIEPHAAGIAAIHVWETGIVDYSTVCERLAGRIRQGGGEVVTGARAGATRKDGKGIVVATTKGEARARVVANCAGLHSDRVLGRTGAKREVRIVPFRGEYFELVPEARRLVRSLIYPVPDPTFPFLGVHFTPTVGGGVECGPNAVLAFAREGYTRWTLRPADLWDTLSYRGFWKMAAKHWRTGGAEMWRSLSRSAFARALQRLVPEVRREHLLPAPAGVRAQALAPDGSLLDDFRIEAQDRIVHVLNAPSPPATSSLSIGEAVVDRLLPILE